MRLEDQTRSTTWLPPRQCFVLHLLGRKDERSRLLTLAWVRSFWGEEEMEFGYRLVWVDLCSYSGP